ncbi:hypothetical protein ACSYDW_08660 [Paeniglutamicibacter sp. R2-26]|uniref:hypothetical protein n=1 Tax=Paeniglutamicibacter sp. R2-26 TaxID=3144417 RepID=UPI003EE65632
MSSTPKVLIGVIAVSLGLALSACSSTEPGGTHETPAPSAPHAAPRAASPEASGGGTSADPLDNGGHAEYTWDDYVKAKRKMSGLTSWPEVDRVRFISEEEKAEVQAGCLTNLGFPTTVESDGSYQTNSTTDQEESLALASYTCALQYPVDLRYAQALTRTQLRTVYTYYRDSLLPCLQAQGLETGQLSSEETYVEGVATGNAPWTPYDAVDLASVDVNALNKACPSMPASDVLYGG